MTNIDIIKKIARENNGVITRRMAMEEGIDSWYFTDLTRNGVLERIARGIYIIPGDGNYDEMFTFQQQNRKCIYSYHSALYLHGLTERVPFVDEITVPHGYNASRFGGSVLVHFIDIKWYGIGIVTMKTEMGNDVCVYDMERTICDLIRQRKKQDPEIFSKAIHMYLRRKDRDIWKLRDYAEKFNLTSKLEDILEVAVNE